VFDERDASTIDASALATVAPDEWPGLRFETIPALRILDLEWSVQATWLAAQSRPDPHPDHEADVPCEGPSHDRDADLPEPAARPVSMRVWRADHQALNREIGEDERAALGSLRDRRPFGEICEAVGALVGDEAAPARVATLLATWLADGLISRVVGGGS
jgi:hypothetical protein